MKAMVLAAGLGTRLRPLTAHTPKPLLGVGGRPLIAYSLLQLSAAGIKDVVVNVHHLAERVMAVLGDGSVYGVRLRYSREETLLDTGGAIARAAPWLGGESFLVLNADSIHDVPLLELAAFHGARNAALTLTLRADPRAREYGLVEIDAAQRVRRFLGQPAVVPAPLTPLMFAGVSVVDPRVLPLLPAGRFSLTRDAIPLLLRAGVPVYGYRYAGYWQVVDTAADLEASRQALCGRSVLSYLGARNS